VTWEMGEKERGHLKIRLKKRLKREKNILSSGKDKSVAQSEESLVPKDGTNKEVEEATTNNEKTVLQGGGGRKSSRRTIVAQGPRFGGG